MKARGLIDNLFEDRSAKIAAARVKVYVEQLKQIGLDKDLPSALRREILLVATKMQLTHVEIGAAYTARVTGQTTLSLDVVEDHVGWAGGEDVYALDDTLESDRVKRAISRAKKAGVVISGDSPVDAYHGNNDSQGDYGLFLMRLPGHVLVLSVPDYTDNPYKEMKLYTNSEFLSLPGYGANGNDTEDNT